MRRLMLQLLLLAFIPLIGQSTEVSNMLQVLRTGNSVHIRSGFNSRQDVIIWMGKGNNGQINFLRTRLVDRDAPMTLETCKGGMAFHFNGDDACPWNINGTYIGGNHGCSDMIVLTSPGHGLSEADIGSAWVDAEERAFYLLKIVDDETLWLMSDNLGGEIWRFHTSLAGESLTRQADDKQLLIAEQKRGQLTPAHRTLSQTYLVDGERPLPENEVVTCRTLNLVDVFDIIAPDAVVAAAKANPGQPIDFVADDLDAVIHNEITYRFQPRGACTVLYDAELKREVRLGYMGFIQSSQLTPQGHTSHDYFIPKTKPFEQYGQRFDFQHFIDFREKMPGAIYLHSQQDNIVSGDDLPDRFLQFLGHEEREIGYVVGYSLLHGETRPKQRAEQSRKALFLWTSNKTYPHAIDQAMGIVPAGRRFHCVAYRQYFAPNAASDQASSVYWHHQADDLVLYAHYHQPVEHDTIRVPAEWNGRRLRIVEQTAGAELLTPTVTDGTISLRSPASYGHLVLVVEPTHSQGMP